MTSDLASMLMHDARQVLQEVLAVSRYGFAQEELDMTLQMTLTKATRRAATCR